MTALDDTILADLTDPQRQAAMHLDGALLVLAGPGSGKTRVITRRVVHLIGQGIPPWQILALTFTNKASGEMRDRIDQLLPEDIPGRRGLTVCTFHALCARLLRQFADEAQISPRFSIYDTADQRDAVKRAMVEAGMDTRNWTPASVLSAISGAKNRLMDAKAFAEESGDFYSKSIAKAFMGYERILKANDALDFDDLLVKVANLLRGDTGVREHLQDRYQYLLIDEYQDTNHAQFVIARKLAEANGNICVVGDPDQAIYGWRGADISNILEFEEHFPNAQVIALGQNFRSTGHIVDAASALIQNNSRRKHKALHTELGEGEKPTVIVCRDEHHEADTIVRELQHYHKEGLMWKDMAVLYRVNALSRVLEEGFLGHQIPYVIAQGTAFYARKEVKDALSYLRVIVNVHDDVAMRRIINTPPRGIGRTTLDRVEDMAMRNGTPFFEALQQVNESDGITARAATAIRKFVSMVNQWRERAIGNQHAELLGRGDSEHEGLAGLVENVIHDAGLDTAYRKSRSEEDQQRLENLYELVSAAADFIPPLPEVEGGQDAIVDESEAAERSLLDVLAAYLESVALVSDADAIDPGKGAVTLMTLHAAKGLEFDAVAIIGMEEGLLPHSRAQSSESELEEERRLCFVGMTRARRYLLMTSAALRTHRGMRERTISSQFLRELPSESITTLDQMDVFATPGSAPGSAPGSGTHGTPGSGGDDFVYDQRPDSEHPIVEAFPRGCIVRHPKFGLGMVESVTPRRSGSSARVNFELVGRKTLILEYAKLERVEE